MRYKCRFGHRVHKKNRAKKRPACKFCIRKGYSGKTYIDRSGYARDRRLKCVCSGVPFPHRITSMYGCEYYKGERSEELHREWFDWLLAHSCKN